ncbi:MAG: GxxExxY protein [Verrucomicrobiota bacterium]
MQLRCTEAKGPGLFKSAYQHCLAYQLSNNQIDFKLEHPMPVE